MAQQWVVSLMDNISEQGLSRILRSGQFTVEEGAADPHAIIVRSRKLPESVVQSPRLTCIARAGAGVDNIPVAAATRRGIGVFNAPGANSNAVKEAVIGSIIALSRHIVPATIALQGSSDVDRSQFVGREIRGRTLGIVGLGMIGGMVAEAALALGMRVLGFDKYLTVPLAHRLPSEVQICEDVREVLRDADILTLHASLTDETENMISADSIAGMKRGALVVNFARAGVVNAGDMRKALDEGYLSGYATDFPAEEYAGCEKVLMTPHIGASTKEAQVNCAAMATDAVMDFLLDGDVRNSVNFPSLTLQRSGKAHRLVFANENVPGMISKVSSLLAEEGINIISMANNSNRDVGYSVVDCAPAPSGEATDRIRRMAGMLMVRSLG